MKQHLFLFFCLVALKTFSQPVTQRSSSSVTVQDSRWMAQYNQFLPRYSDTTVANIQKGVDTAGAIIYTYDVKGVWIRQHSPKKWVLLSSSAPSLNEVTSVGAWSSNNISIRLNSTSNQLAEFGYVNSTGFTRVSDTSTGYYLTTLPDRLLFVKGLNSGTLRWDGLASSSKTIDLPNATGTLPMSINSKTANSSGAVTLTPSDLITSGTTQQYYRGDLVFASMPDAVRRILGDSLFGGKYGIRVAAGVLNVPTMPAVGDPITWALLDSTTAHDFSNFTTVTTNAAGTVRVSFTNGRILYGTAVVDENLAAKGVFVGSGVATTYIEINMYRLMTPSGYIYWDGTTPTFGGGTAFNGLSMSYNTGTGELVMTGPGTGQFRDKYAYHLRATNPAHEIVDNVRNLPSSSSTGMSYWYYLKGTTTPVAAPAMTDVIMFSGAATTVPIPLDVNSSGTTSTTIDAVSSNIWILVFYRVVGTY